jgi:hypothetical protein
MSFRRTLIVVGDDPDDPLYAAAYSHHITEVTREDSKVMLTTMLGTEELEIIIQPGLYPKMMEIMKDWERPAT